MIGIERRMARAAVRLIALGAIALAVDCTSELDVLTPGEGSALPAGDGSASICRVEGESCMTAADCCTALCLTGPDGARCRSLDLCVMADGETCARQAGESCSDSERCCTGECVASIDGATRCAYAGGCHQLCEVCRSDAECCSGRCAADASGVARCAAPAAGSCIGQGEICNDGAPCCAGGESTQCVKLAPPLLPKRCYDAPAAPLADGSPCAVAQACSGGFCVPSAGGALACAGACRREGEACTATSDCCDAATHACVPVAGVPTCVARAF